MTNHETRFSIYFTMNPTWLKNSLGIKTGLKRVDWQVLKEYPFGTLGYDYEEGIKLVGNFENLSAAIEFCNNLRKEANIPLYRKDNYPYISFDLTGLINYDFNKKFEEAGLVKSSLGYTFAE